MNNKNNDTKKTKTTKTTEVVNTSTNSNDELIKALQEQNSLLAEKLNTALEALNSKQESKVEVRKESKIKTQKSIIEKFKDIEPTRRVVLVHMIYAGGTYKTSDGRPTVRFDGFGNIQPIRFEDLQNMVARYRNRFQDLQIRILDDEVIDALYLREFYNKYDISDDEMRNLISLDAQKMIAKIQSLSKPLQEAAIALIIDGVAKNDSMYMDRNKWQVINNAFNVDIEGFARNYTSN
jgi:3-methyladenine DNA glycosylase AlkC